MVNPTAAHNLDGPGAILSFTRPTVSYYLVLALIVTPFCAVTPVSWCYVAYSLYTGAIWTFTLRRSAFFAVALAEVGPTLHEHVISDDELRRRVYLGVLQRIPLQSGEIRFRTFSHSTWEHR